MGVMSLELLLLLLAPLLVVGNKNLAHNIINNIASLDSNEAVETSALVYGGGDNPLAVTTEDFAQMYEDNKPEGTCGGFVDTIAEIPGAGSCLPLLKEMCKQVGNNEFNVYNMYDTCFPNDGLSLDDIRQKLRKKTVETKGWWENLRSHPALNPAVENTVDAPLGQLNDYACGSETLMGKWLDSKDVQDALNVVSNGGGMRYKQTCGDLRPLYAKLVPKHKMLIYSGNVDACVPTWGSEFWTSELGLKYGAPSKEWHPWTSNSADPGSSKKVLAGYAVTYAVNNFTFATVKGAGHEVPRYKPQFALTLLQRFMAGEAI